MESSASIKWRTQRLSLCLRFVTIVASLAAVISFGYTQDLHDRDVLTAADLGHHIVSPVTGTVSFTLPSHFI
jgi:hypothetical protein